jgi:hypothetical protein
MWLFSIYGHMGWTMRVGNNDYCIGLWHQAMRFRWNDESFRGPAGWQLGWSSRPDFNPHLPEILKGTRPGTWIQYPPSGKLNVVMLVLPVWLLLVVVALPTTFLFWYDRRIPPGHCQKCGYSLTGNTSGVCPECGEKV